MAVLLGSRFLRFDLTSSHSTPICNSKWKLYTSFKLHEPPHPSVLFLHSLKTGGSIVGFAFFNRYNLLMALKIARDSELLIIFALSIHLLRINALPQDHILSISTALSQSREISGNCLWKLGLKIFFLAMLLDIGEPNYVIIRPMNAWMWVGRQAKNRSSKFHFYF